MLLYGAYNGYPGYPERYDGKLPFDDVIVALLLPFAAGAAADRTALVATAGLFVRQLAVALSNPG